MPAFRFNSASNPLEIVAAAIFDEYGDDPTELRNIQLLLPEAAQSHVLRRKLLERFNPQGALFAPRISTLQEYVTARTAPDGHILNNHAQELMLVEVLQEHGYSWQMADELLRWFEALELNNHHPNELQSELTNSGFSGFNEDAAKLAILWKAWQTQLQDERATTRSNQYRKGLLALTIDQPLYVIGYDWLQELELSFITRHIDDGLTIWVQPDQPLHEQLIGASIPVTDATPPTGGGRNEALDILFSQHKGASLIQRCEQWKQKNTTVFDGLHIFAAANPEEEAIAIDRQVRAWINEGKRNIAIVTEDRRLARRASAILRRAEINLYDEAGWPLSTTTAAGVVERWLETIETDFAQQPLLDVLKTSFTHASKFKPQVIYQFQRDIIEREKVPAQISRYRKAVRERSEALPVQALGAMADIEALLDLVEAAAQPLLKLTSQPRHSPERYVHALRESLIKLGLFKGLTLDAAGQRITQELTDMEQAAKQRSLSLSWAEFRAWFGRALETHNFRPGRNLSGVSLLKLEQSRLGDYDAIMLAGAGEKQLPGPSAKHIFFNDSARYALKLKTRETARQLSFSRFRRLIESTQDVVISYTAAQNGEPKLPSPWVSLLQSFAQTTEDNSLFAEQLTALVRSPNAAIHTLDLLAPPAPPSLAAPQMPADLIPSTLSASGHQTLIDCPYRYFANYSLGLRAHDDIVEQLTKREFGNIVHAALQNFYAGGDSTLPGPFDQQISPSTADAAREHLLEIGRQLLKNEPATGFEQQGWHQAWTALAANIIDWELEQNTGWRNHGNEIELTRPIPKTETRLFGKIDRIDRKSEEERILDYKTGTSASAKQIASGESVQLLTYALLDDKATEAGYLPLTADKEIKTKNGIPPARIDELREQALKRLTEMLSAMKAGAQMPANGESNAACKHCKLDGLCRTEVLAEHAAD